MGNTNRYTPALWLAMLLINPGQVAAEEVHRVRLNLDTPFTHRNVLRTRLQAGNVNPLDCTINSSHIDFISSDREIFPAHQVFSDRSNDIVSKNRVDFQNSPQWVRSLVLQVESFGRGLNPCPKDSANTTPGVPPTPK